MLQAVYEAGARIFVAGNAVYGSGDIHGAIIQLKYKVNVALEKSLPRTGERDRYKTRLVEDTQTYIDSSSNELGIEEELHALK